jgi:hypothetical protein
MIVDDASEKKEETPEIVVVESDDDDDREEEEEKEEEEEEESSWDVLEKSEASGEDENERTMREERSDREAVVAEKKRVSLSPPASLDVGVDTGKKSGEENEGKGEEEGEEEEEEEENSSEKTTRKGEEGTEEDSDEFSNLGEVSKRSDDDEEAAAAEEEKKTALDSLKTEVRVFFHNARKNASRAPTVVTNAWRRLARDARRRFRDLLKRVKAFKDGLSEDDKNLLKAAGVLVGAIVAVNVSKAIIGGRSSAPFT